MPAGNRIFQSDPEVGKHRQELRGVSHSSADGTFLGGFRHLLVPLLPEFCTVWDFPGVDPDGGSRHPTLSLLGAHDPADDGNRSKTLA